MNKAKSLLKKYPQAYHFCQSAYHAFREGAERLVLGDRLEEWIWKARGNDWAAASIEKSPHLHRRIILEKISRHPFASLLEIGCAAGVNINLIARRFPKCRIVGIDINKNAIKTGRNFFAAEGIKNVELGAGRFDDLEKIADKSFDVVLTDAVLIYAGPGKIKKIAKEMARIACRRLILVEHHSAEKSAAGSYNGSLWLRDYVKLFRELGFAAEITKIPPEIWGGDWGKFGAIIEVELSR